MSGPYRVELLNSGHPRAAFDCGVEALNAYLQRQASQDAKRRVSACYVAITKSPLTNNVVNYPGLMR